jgi:hypothetical protein
MIKSKLNCEILLTNKSPNLLNNYIGNSLTTSSYTTIGYYALIKNNSNFWTHKDMNII